MSALRKDVQRNLFQSDEERLQAIVHAVKVDNKKKKRPTFLCLTVSLEHPISVRLYIVKGERDDIYKKKERHHLRDIREIDGISPKKMSPDFKITIADRRLTITAASAEEKDEFIRELYKLSAQYLPVQMPDFCNVSLPVDSKEDGIIPIEVDDLGIQEVQHDYQPITAKEEADFRRLLANAEISIGDADKFAAVLTAELQNLDGANIKSMLESEMAVNQLLSTIDTALEHIGHLEKQVDSCDAILSAVRNSVELIEEKDSLSVVEKKNKEKLREQLRDFVAALDAVTDEHIRTLKDSRLDDAATIARCAEAARAVSHFWHGRVPKALLQMKAYQDRNSKLDVIDLFVDRLISHFTALFNNLNELTSNQDWHDLVIPKQSQRFRALAPLAELMSWLKVNRPVPYAEAMQRYINATSSLYSRLFSQFFHAIKDEVDNLGKTGTLQSKANSSSRSYIEFNTDTTQISKLIETVLGELGPIVDAEQKFCVRFFHINSELLAAAETASTGSGDSSSIGGRNIEKFMNEQVRGVMSQLMDSANDHLRAFAESICKQNPSNVLILFMILSKKVLAPTDPGSYFSVTFGTLVVLVKRQFDSYMEMEGNTYNEYRFSKKTRLGLLPQVDRFTDVIRNAELIFAQADRRTDLEKWYGYLCRALIRGIDHVSIHFQNKNPPSVVRFENYHHLYSILYELKVTCLEAYRKEAKKLRDDNIALYVKDSLGKPLEKVQNFFDGITATVALTGVKPENISFQQNFSRVELKKVVALYPPKEVKKGLDQLYKKMEKHMTDNSPLLQVVWREMQEQFIKQLQEYNVIMDDCYKGQKLEVTIEQVLGMFSDIAQQH